MADAMCGPANALKGLAGHLDRDNSRQQDRFGASPHAAAQNFRSSPANSSSANASFAAFQNGNNVLSGPYENVRASLPLHAPVPQAPGAFQARGPWQMNGAPAQMSQAPQVQHSGQSWINDFQQMNVSQPVQQSPMLAGIQQPQTQYGAMFQRPMMGGPTFGFNSQLAPMSMQMPTQADPLQATKAEDDFDFDAALSQWMVDNSGSQEQAATLQQSTAQTAEEAVLQENLDAQIEPQIVLEEAVMDTVVPREEPENEKAPLDNHDSGELAAAARQVVQSVSNETNEKFAKSDFFALMRRLGDNELVLRGTEFVEPGAPESGPAQEPSGSGMRASVEDA